MTGDITQIESLGSRVVSVGLAPFIRSKAVSFSTSGLKPNTRFYAFFDGEDVTTYCTPSPLVSDARGVCTGVFTIPNNETLRFRIGQRVFTLSDDIKNRPAFRSSFASTVYDASGITETTQNTIISTRIPEIVWDKIIEERVPTPGTSNPVDNTNNGTNVGTIPGLPPAVTPVTPPEAIPLPEVSPAVPTTTFPLPEDWDPITSWNFNFDLGNSLNWRLAAWDPLAQTFTVTGKSGGVFAHSLDLFFRKKAAVLPVWVEIREVVNGYPGAKILPFSHVDLYPANIEVSENASVATRIPFLAPVYLKGDTDYAFVVGSSSNDYEVFVAKIGEFDVNGNRITAQPHAGSLFKSQNTKTWTADQETDLAFRLNVCVFDTAATGQAVFKNVAILPTRLISNPLETFLEADGVTIAPRLRVYHQNHGLLAGETVTIAGAVTGNGVTDTSINGVRTILSPTTDTYEISIASDPADQLGRFGGYAVTAIGNMRIDGLTIKPAMLDIPAIQTDWSIRGTNKTGPTSYTQDASFTRNLTPFRPEELKSPMAVLSQANETLKISGNKSFAMRGTMKSYNRYLSPVLDTTKMSLEMTANRINMAPYYPDAAYVTKLITLAESAIDLRVYLAAFVPQGAHIKVFGKFTPEDDTSNSTYSLPWVEMKQIEKYKFDTFADYTFEPMTAVPQFNAFAVKVVFLSPSTSLVPRIKDFRAIALGT